MNLWTIEVKQRFLSHIVQRRKPQMSYRIVVVVVAAVDIEQQSVVEMKIDDAVQVKRHRDGVDDESDENVDVERTIHFVQNHIHGDNFLVDQDLITKKTNLRLEQVDSFVVGVCTCRC